MAGTTTRLLLGALLLALCCQCGARAVREPDAAALVAETMGKFNYRTYYAAVNTEKVYNPQRSERERLLLRYADGEPVGRMMLQVKPQGDRQGLGMLLEEQGGQISNAYRYLPGERRVVPASLRQRSNSVVISGLSLQDFLMLQGISAFRESALHGRETRDGKDCYVIDSAFADQSDYHRAKLYTTTGERLPVLIVIYDKGSKVIKEISFDQLERENDAYVLRRLTVRDALYGYTSTFTFDDVRINSPLPDGLFTQETLGRGWPEETK